MTGDIGDLAESAGNLATGGIIAHAVDGTSAAGDGHTHESRCLNCDTALIGPHCHACGQRAHIHRTLGAFFHDLLHGVLHFEGKTWRTIPLLAWKPGQLTREYIDGKRARYVSPIALFLFIVFLSYALFSLLGGSANLSPGVNGLEEARAAYARNEDQIAALEAKLPGVTGDAARKAEIEDKLKGLKDDQQGLGMVLGDVTTNVERDFKAGFEESPLPEGNPISEAIQHVTANPQLAIYKAQTNAYKFSWMLIPLSVPFVWLLFPFSRRFRGYDHTVFATYSITFMIALVALVSLLFFYNLGSIGGMLLLYAPLHMYRQLRGTYDLGRWGAFWRMLALSLFAWIAIALFASAIAVMVA